MAFGYDPRQDQENEPGGCREVFVLTRVVLGVVLPPLTILVVLMFSIILTPYLFLTVHPLLALLGLLPAASILAWVIRRDLRLHREIREGKRPPPGRPD